jgi:hypothetical protein
VDTSSFDIASINGARFFVITIFSRIDASLFGIASIDSTFVGIQASHTFINASSGFGIARISGTCIFVVTILSAGVNTFVKSAKEDLAFVGIFFVHRCNVYLLVDTSFLSIASICGARIVIIASDCIVMDGSGCNVAVIFGASIVVINLLWLESATEMVVASICGARIVIITNNWSRYASFVCIAGVFGAFVSICADFSNMSAFAGVNIAAIDGTCIFVVTINILVIAFSREFVALTCFASLFCTNNRSEYALSVGTFVVSAFIIVITNFVAVDASFHGIAFSNAAFICSITFDWLVLNSIFGGTEVSCASIVIIKLNGRERNMFASNVRTASIDSARIFVIARYRSINAFFLVSRATINGAQVFIVTMLRTNIGENTSFFSVASFVSARILVITNNYIMMNLSRGEITPIGGTCIFVINHNDSVDTFSGSLITFINSAWVLVITNNRFSNNSKMRIASDDFAEIVSCKRDRDMGTS